jgi:ADP-heptose:LPS heptosyltransferase
MGDVLVATPALRTLKAAFPRAHLTCAAQAPVQEVLFNNSDIDELVSYDPNTLRQLLDHRPPYDLALHLMGGFDAIPLLAGARIRVGRYRLQVGGSSPYNVLADVSPAADVIEHFLAFTRALGLPDASRKTCLVLTPEEHDFAASFWEDSGLPGAGPVVGLHPGGCDPKRLWAPEHYARAADGITARTGCPILVFQGPGERETAESVCRQMQSRALLAPLLEVRKYAALVGKCRLFLTSDGGPLHIAAAVGVRLLAIFRDEAGADRWFPYGDQKGRLHLLASAPADIFLQEVVNAALKLYNEP